MDGSDGCNYLAVEDFHHPSAFTVVCPRLELYRSVESTFIGGELLGRPTDHSVTVNAMSLLTLEIFVEWGTTLGVYPYRTDVETIPGWHAVRGRAG